MEHLFPLEGSWYVVVIAGAFTVLALYLLKRKLPAQNVLMIAVCLLLAEALFDFGLLKFNHIDLEVPLWRFLLGAGLLWLVVVLTGRWVARLILDPWRGKKYFGIWVLGLSALAVGAFQYVWPTFNHDPLNDPVGQDVAAIMGLVRGATAAGLLAALSPWFIRKKPISRRRHRMTSELAEQPKDEANSPLKKGRFS